MVLTPGIVIVVAAVAIAMSIVLIRWVRRHEAPPPIDSPLSSPVRTAAIATAERESQSLVNWLLDHASEQTGVRVADDPLAHKRIVEAAVKAMEDLRNHGSATVSLPFLTADARGPKHFAVRVKRNLDSTLELQR